MINPAKYKIITDIINYAQSNGTNMINNISLMSDHLVASDVPDNNVNKLWFFNTIQRNYNAFNNSHVLYSRKMLNFVESLQVYITAEYGDVNNYLSDNNIKVLPIFADLSEAVGFPIDPTNIDYGLDSFDPEEDIS